MLENVEFSKDLGGYGTASVDVTPDLKLEVAVSAEVDLVAELKKLAAKTNTPIDDTAIEWIEKLLVLAK